MCYYTKTKEASNTKNINVNVTRPPTNIQLGRQGENLATCIIFDCSGLVQLYGDGTAELLHELKDGTIYPVAVTQDGASVSWTVSTSDTATVGAGRAELRWYVGDTLAKSAKFRTSVSSALADSTTETPPEPQKSWVDKVLQAAQEIKDGAISDEKLAAAIAAYLEEHPIDAGLDEAALAAYLTENGYLTDEVLANAVAQALAEAKASGEFDGAPGMDGTDGGYYTPSVDADGNLTWTPSAEDMPAVASANIRGPRGEAGPAGVDGAQGPKGDKGDTGAQGPQGPAGADGKPGTSGKSAYQYAVDGGYTGTEAEFAAKLAETNSSGGTSEWRHIRNVVIPEDITTDDSGVSFSARENGGYYFAFDTDENGEPFELNELFIVYSAGSSKDSSYAPSNSPVNLGNSNVPNYYLNGALSPSIAMPIAVGKTSTKSTGWAKCERFCDKLLSSGAYNSGSVYPSMNAARSPVNVSGKFTAINAWMSNMSAYGFESGSTFDIYGR